MFHIAQREFIDSFKSIRSILIILFITFVSYQSANFLYENQEFVSELIDIGESEGAIYSLATTFIFIVFGFLFVFAISHNVINKELELKTIRLLVTKVSRIDIVVGKLIGMLLFWISIILVTYGIIFLFAPANYLRELSETVVLFFYIVTFVLFMSTIITKSLLSMFLGVFLSIIFPILGLLSTVFDKWYFILFKYILPFYYLDNVTFHLVFPVLIGCLFIILAITVMERRDF